jgi:hypothetical protein
LLFREETVVRTVLAGRFVLSPTTMIQTGVGIVDKLPVFFWYLRSF